MYVFQHFFNHPVFNRHILRCPPSSRLFHLLPHIGHSTISDAPNCSAPLALRSRLAFRAKSLVKTSGAFVSVLSLRVARPAVACDLQTPAGRFSLVRQAQVEFASSRYTPFSQVAFHCPRFARLLQRAIEYICFLISEAETRRNCCTHF